MKKHYVNVSIGCWEQPTIKQKGTNSKGGNLFVKNRLLSLLMMLCLFMWSNDSLGQCNTPAACDPACPAICITDATLNGVASTLCRGTSTQLLCLDWNGAGDPATINVDYTLTPSLGETISLVPNATMDQVCVVVDIPTTADCTTTSVTLEINAITPDPATAPGNCTLAYDLDISSPLAVTDQECDVNTGTITFLNLPLLPTLNGQLDPFTVFPDPANFMQYTVQEDAACGVAPAIIPVPMTCPPVVVASTTGNSPATAEVCEPPVEGVNGTYSWDITSGYPIGEGGCPPIEPVTETGVIPFCPAEPACVACPIATTPPVIPDDLCFSGLLEPVEFCYTFDADPSGVTLTINGFEAMPGGVENTLCAMVPIPDPLCSTILFDITVAATCEGATVEGITDGVIGSFTVYPDPANFAFDPPIDGVCGEDALLPPASTGACPITFTEEGTPPDPACPAPEDVTITYTPTIAGEWVATWPCPIDLTPVTAIAPGCDNCATCPSQGVAIYQPVCAPSLFNVCIDFGAPVDDTVIIDVDGTTAAGTGENTICVDRPVDDVVCEPVNALITATCNGDPILIEFGFAPPTIFPDPANFVLDVTPSAGCGEAPVILDSTCPTLTAEGWVDDIVPAEGCPPVDGTYSWTQTIPAELETAPCQYPDGSGVEPVSGCTTCTDCPKSVVSVDFAPAVCSDGMLEVCVTFDAEVTATTNIDLDGAVYDGAAGGTQICGDVLVPTNESCAPSEFGFALVAQCGETIYDLGVWIDPLVYPAPFDIVVVDPTCGGEAGSATVVSAGGEACDGPINGTAGANNVCPETTDTDAVLSYAFGPYFEGTGCDQAGFSGDIIVDCLLPCEVCPESAILSYPTPVCVGEPTNVCIDFGTPIDPGSVSATINGIPATIDDTGFALCVILENTLDICGPTDASLDVSALCGGDAIAVSFPDNPLTVYPNLTIALIEEPNCVDNDGELTVTNDNGTVCGGANGSIGIPNVCPETVDTDALIFWDFTNIYGSFPCIIGELAGSVSVDCSQPCSDCEAIAGTATIEGAETCEDGTVTLPLTGTVTGAAGGTSNLIVTDGSGGVIVDVNGDLSSATVGAEICVTPFTYVQSDFDGLIDAVNQWCTDNAAICGLLPAGTLPLPAGSTLEDIFNLAAGLGAAVDINTILTLINNGAGGTVDLGEALGLPPGFVVIDIPTICFDLGEEVCVIPVESCPVGACVINEAIVAEVLCSDNGTADDPSDDTFTFTVTVTGVNTSASWTATDPNGTAGVYGTPVAFGPYPISGGALNFIIADVGIDGCIIEVQVDPPATCSNPTECDVVPPTVGIEATETCADGSVVGPFTITSTGGSGGDIYYGVSDPNDPNTPGVISVVSQLTSDIETEVNTNFLTTEFCIISITIAPADLEAFIVAFNALCDDPVFEPLCPGFGLPLDPATTTLTDIFDLNQSLGGEVTVDFIEQLINFGNGGTVDAGVLFGLPPDFLVLEIPTVCYVVGEEVCVTPVESCPIEECSITEATVAGVSCNNNGTPDNPDDDTFTFTVTVTGTGISANWNATDPNGTTGAYGTAVSFGPYPISGGALSFNITDSANETCTIAVQVDPPATCSDPNCPVVAGSITIEGADVCPDGSIVGPVTITDNGSSGGTIEYIVLDGAGGNILTVEGSTTDAETYINTNGVDTFCVQSFVYVQEDFDALIVAVNDLCNNPIVIAGGGCAGLGLPLPLPTGSTIADIYNLVAGLAGPGALTVADVEAIIGNGAGGIVDIGELAGFPAGLLTLEIPPICYQTGPEACTTLVASCSEDCIITDVAVEEIICSDNGTADDPADDTFTFTITVSGANTGTGWVANDAAATTGTYGTATSFGPFPISGGAISFTVTDDTDETCTFDVLVDPPAPCSGTVECTADAGTPAFPTQVCEGEDIDPLTIPADASVAGCDAIGYVYLALDGPGGFVIDVSDDGTGATGDLVIGDQICWVGIVYCQVEFDAIIQAAIDFGLPIAPGSGLPELYDLAITFGLITPGAVTVGDIIALIETQLPLFLGIDAPCLGVSEEACFTVEDCGTGGGCQIEAGTAAVVGESVCTSGQQVGPYSVTYTSGTGGGTEFIVLTDAATGNIITVATDADIQTYINDNPGDYCLTPFSYLQEDLDAIITTINDALAGFGLPPLLPTGGTIGDLFATIGAIGGGAPITIADVETFIATLGGSIDIGALLGLPIPLVIEIPELCYDLGDETCIETVEECPCEADNGVFPFKGN